MFEYQNLWSQFWYGFVFDFVENHNGCQCFANFMPNRIPIKKLPFNKYFSKVVCFEVWNCFEPDGIWGFWSSCKLERHAKKNEMSNLRNVVEYCYVRGTLWFSLIPKNSLDYKVLFSRLLFFKIHVLHYFTNVKQPLQKLVHSNMSKALTVST